MVECSQLALGRVARRRLCVLHVPLGCDEDEKMGLVEVVGFGLITCEEGELVGGVHTLVGGVMQVYHRLQVQEEEEKERKVEQETERENQVEVNAQVTVHIEMKGLTRLEPRCVCG